jgi:uncharacterized membrane protein YfcA
METLSGAQLSFCAAVFVAAYAVRGGTGFGGGAFAVPLLAFTLPVPIAVSVVALLNIANSMGMVRRDWRKIVWPELKRLLPYTLVGIAAGLYLLAVIDEGPLRHALGVFLIVYSTYALITAGSSPGVSARWRAALAAGTGSVGGFIGVIFGGASGAVYAIYLNVLKLDKDAFRVTVTTVILIGLFARIAGYASLGFYGVSAWIVLAAAVPGMIVGSWLGDRLVRRFDQKQFGRFVAATLMASGVALLLK